MRVRGLNAGPAKFKYPKTVPHTGRVFAFAAKLGDDGTYRIGYTALSSQSSNPDDDAIWTDFVALPFPRELRPVGRGLIVIDFEDAEIPAADVAFEVVSDDSYIYVFRQSTNRMIYVDRFVFDEVTGRLINVWETRYRRSRKFDLPLDRKDTFGSTDMEGKHFVEPTTELTFITDVVDGRFAVAILPTELPRVSRWQIFAERQITGTLDGFSILRSTNGLFDLSDSLDPDTEEVPPDASYRLTASDGSALALATGATVTIYNRQELLADEYGRPQLQKRALRLALAVAACTDPRIAVIDFGVGKDGKLARVGPDVAVDVPVAAPPPIGTGLLFVPQRAGQVAIPAITGAPTTAMTFEAWVNPRAIASGTAWIVQSATGAALPFGLALVDGVPTFTVGSATATAVDALEAGYWSHLAGVWDGQAAVINVNGQPWREPGVAPGGAAPPATGYLLGGAAGFEGTLDEIRLWRVARTEAELLATMGTAMSSQTPGWADLVGYWTCDEPADDTRFTVVANTASTGAAASGALDGAMWVRTSAPVGASMSPISWDDHGLTVCTALLGFAATDAPPALIDGGDSLLHLYWSNRGDRQMMAAQLGCVLARASYTAPWLAADPAQPANDQRGEVCFIARYPGTWMNQATASPAAVTITVDPGNAALASVVLRSTAGLTETWPAVPRNIAQLTAVLNGTALQTTSDPDAAQAGVVLYDYTKVVVQATGAQRGPQPAPGSGSNVFSAMPVEDADNGMTALIEATDANPERVRRYRAGIDAWWQYVPPPSTLELAPGQLVRVLSSTQIPSYDGPLAVAGNLALEAWVQPLGFPDNQSQTVLVFNQAPASGSADLALGSRYLLSLDPTGHVVCAKGEVAAITVESIAPGTWAHIAGSYRTDYGVQLGGSRFLDAGNAQSLISTEAVTVEAWVRIDRLGGTQTIASKWSEQLGRSWALEVRPDGKVAFTVNQDTGTSELPRTVMSATALDTGKWHHVAGVYTVEMVKEVALSFNTGSYVKLPQLSAPPSDAVSVMMWIKLVGPAKLGKQVLIQSIDPQQPVPFLLYLFNGVPTFTVIVNGTSSSVRLPTTLRQNDWVHIAGTYSAELGLALYIDGQALGQPVTNLVEAGAGAEIATAPSAGVTAAYSVGGFATTDSFTGVMNQVSIWNRGLTANEVRQRIARPPSASDRGLAGYWPFQDMFGTTVMDLAGTSNGELVAANWIRIDKGQFAHKVFLDGVVQAFDHVTDPVIGKDAPPVLLGSGYYASFLQGALGEVRLWKTGRMNWQIEYFAARDLESAAEGLLANWTFQAGKGNVVSDQKGDSNAVIRDATIELGRAAIDAMWIHTTFKAAWTIFIDGAAQTTVPYTLDRVGYGDPQAAIGSLIYQQSIARIYSGELNELRVWRTQRTLQQIRENMHVQLEAGEPGLAAYWTVSDGSSTTLADFTGFGANATWYGDGLAGWRASTAPVGLELPQIRCTLGGLVTPWLATSLFAPGAAQYGAFEVDAEGAAIAVYQRAYMFIRDPDQDLALFGTFKVGDLDVQYVGQAQMAPTLIGYIEGPPPLPAENLKVFPGDPLAYLGASYVAVEETNARLLSYSASRDNGFDMNITSSLGINFETKTSAGIGVSTLLFGFIANLGIRATFDLQLGWLANALISNETRVTARRSVEVRGGWQPNVYAIDGGVGDMFFPRNMGYAQVRSGTADVYALRIKGTGALVSYQLRPNPDIPDDVNIIMFKLRPTYVKNGTLDGWIGFEPEKDAYRNLAPGEYGSYFKPLEAYALKQLIAREHQQLKSYYENFDAGAVGRRQNVVNFRPGDIGDTSNDLSNVLMGVRDRQALSSEDWRARMARRNMVNTYVWTSDGGLYTEEEQFTAVREDQSGGSYSFTGTTGAYSEAKFSAGVSFELDAMFGGHIITQALKTQNESAGFTVNTLVPGESYIGRIKDDSGDLVYSDEPSPGKVRGYRFMSFYLAPSKRNFDDFRGVVDEEWLYRTGPYAGSFDPDALALREALGNVNEVWRLLHRVTYVSRTPPQRQDDTQSIPKNDQPPDQESVTNNYWLIGDLPLGQGPNPMVAVSQEADRLLDQLQQNPVWGSLLAAQRAEVKQQIIKYMTSYYAA